MRNYIARARLNSSDSDMEIRSHLKNSIYMKNCLTRYLGDIDGHIKSHPLNWVSHDHDNKFARVKDKNAFFYFLNNIFINEC